VTEPHPQEEWSASARAPHRAAPRRVANFSEQRGAERFTVRVGGRLAEPGVALLLHHARNSSGRKTIGNMKHARSAVNT